MSLPDSNKLQRNNVRGDMKDRISNLPDCILHHILSLLPTKYAIQTSVLAKRWKYLWTDLSVFDFKTINLPVMGMTEHQRRKYLYCLLDQVHRLLHHSDSVERLSVKYIGVTVDADRVNYLISSVLKHKIEELKLSLLLNTPIVLPNCFSASESLNKLHLDLSCVLNVPSGIHFPSLKTLKLSYITFANARSVQRLFSGCPVLQKLTLCNCKWNNIKQISIKLPTLKILTICCLLGVLSLYSSSTVKIDAANLEHFSCKSHLKVEFVLVNPASIVNAHIDVEPSNPASLQTTGPSAIKLLRGLCSIKSLRLSNNTLECLSCAKSSLHLLPMFSNLTHLHVDSISSKFTNEALMDILEMTPKLEVLDIPKGFDPQICLDGEDWILNSVPCCFKYSLKLFSISNFDGGEAEIQLLKFLLEHATVLAEIQIFCSKTLSVDLKKQTEISNQLQHVGLGSCVIKFQ